MGNGAYLSFKGPLSLVCGAAGESMKVFFLKVKMIMLLSKRMHSNFSDFPHRTIYHEQCCVLLGSALTADLPYHSSVLVH